MVLAKDVLEAALLSASEPLGLADMSLLFEGEVSHEQLLLWLAELQQSWQGRTVQLVQVGNGWRFQTAASVATQLARLNPEKPPKYSRAVLETLAIIAYRQPVTRGDIEQIRGVTVSSQIIKQLEDREWIESIGYREVVGRPALFATTQKFLTDLGLTSLRELPALADETSAGQVDWVEQLSQTPSHAAQPEDFASFPQDQDLPVNPDALVAASMPSTNSHHSH